VGVVGLIAIIMAGGLATRFSTRVEKALLEISGMTLLERAMSALRGGGASELVVATTGRTEKTTVLARELGAEVLVTSGTDYHEDILELLHGYDAFVSLNVDVPFVREDHVRSIVQGRAEGSIAAVVPFRLAVGTPDDDSVIVDSAGRKMVWVGLNYVTPNPENTLKVFEDPLLTININNEEDLALARRIATERGL
jgi:GTP:adenosylcobinamide-phosphate guanylyltransferase